MSAPFMQLYVADYLGDTRHLTTEQHGAYLLLLMTMWRSDGRLPNDPKKLARIAGCTPSRWAKIADDVMAFFEADGDDLTNARLTFELEKAREKSIKRAVSGTKGGRAKALKNTRARVANATPSPEHSSEPEPEGKEAIASSPERAPKPDDDFETFWRAYPAKIGKKAAAAAWSKAKDRPPLDEVLAAIDRYRRAKPPDRDWCHPSTWLNQGRWADEPPPPQQPGPRNDRPANDHHPDRPSAFAERLRAIDDAMAAAVGAGSG